MGFDWDKVKTIWDLWDEDTIEEVRREYTIDKSLYAARYLVSGLAPVEACAAISFQSTNMQSPNLCKFNQFTNRSELHRRYTVVLVHGLVVDMLESDDVLPLSEYIYRLKGLNPMVDAEPVFVEGEGEVIGLKELHALCRKR